MQKTQFKTVDEYIEAFPQNIQDILQQLRHTIRTAAPEAQEKISYQILAFSFHGNLVYFGAFKNHIGFYPTSSAIRKFKKELSGYQVSKGTLQFPFNEPLPLSLIKKIVKFRVKETLAGQKKK